MQAAGRVAGCGEGAPAISDMCQRSHTMKAAIYQISSTCFQELSQARFQLAALVFETSGELAPPQMGDVELRNILFA